MKMVDWVCALSQLAKDRSFDARDRAVMYAHKTRLSTELLASGELQASAVVLAPWAWGEAFPACACAAARQWASDGNVSAARRGSWAEAGWQVPPQAEEVRASFEQVVASARDRSSAVDWSVLERWGVEPGMTPLARHLGRAQRRWQEVRPDQLRRLHPQGATLVGLSRPGERVEVLHLPLLDWPVSSEALPPARRREDSGFFVPTRAGALQVRPERVLQALDIPLSDFPGGLRRRGRDQAGGVGQSSGVQSALGRA